MCVSDKSVSVRGSSLSVSRRSVQCGAAIGMTRRDPCRACVHMRFLRPPGPRRARDGERDRSLSGARRRRAARAPTAATRKTNRRTSAVSKCRERLASPLTISPRPHQLGPCENCRVSAECRHHTRWRTRRCDYSRTTNWSCDEVSLKPNPRPQRDLRLRCRRRPPARRKLSGPQSMCSLLMM